MKSTLPLLLFLSLGVGLTLYFNPEWIKGPIRLPDTSVQEEYSHSLSQVHLIEARQEKKEWELTALRAHSRKQSSDWLLHQVEVIFVDDQNMEVRVKGDQAVYNTKERNLSIKGHVRATTKNGYQVETEELIYTSSDRLLKSSGTVQIQKQGLPGQPLTKIESGFLSTSLKDQTLFLDRQVQMARGSLEQAGVQVQAGQAQLSRSNRTLEFYHDLKMAWGPNQFQGQMAKFEYDPKTDFLSHVWIEKDVRYQGFNRSARCQKAHLEMQSGYTTLSGTPIIWEQGHRIEGEVIRIDHERDAIQVELLKGEFVEESEN